MHRSTWDPEWGGNKRNPELEPVIVFCLPCQMYAQKEEEMKAKGMTGPGYHIVWRRKEYD